LGYPKHAVEGRKTGNWRNGARSKTVLTEVGEVEIEVPRDREGSFEPKIVRKRQRRMSGVDELVISLAAKGLTTGEIAAHLGDVYGAEVSKDTISRITDAVIEELTAWHQVLTEILNRGTVDGCIVVCDGLKGLPEAIADVWPQAIVQTCVLHLIRNSFRYASKADWGPIAKDLRPIYTAPTEQPAADRLDAVRGEWGTRYPPVPK